LAFDEDDDKLSYQTKTRPEPIIERSKESDDDGEEGEEEGEAENEPIVPR